MSKSSKLVLVLGANGFLGSHLVDSLVNKGYRVRAFDKFKSTGEIKFKSSSQVEVFVGDFLNQQDLTSALTGVEIVYHLVSTTTPVASDADPMIDLDTNVRGSVELFKRCVEASQVKHVLYTSSGGTVYGDIDTDKLINESTPTAPVSPYGIGKVAIENYLAYFKRKYDLNYTVFRVANPYGERQSLLRKQGVIPIFTDLIMHDKTLNVYGDGSMVRDYIYVKDAAEIMASVIENDLALNETINVSTGHGSSVNDIISEIEQVTGKTAKIKFLPKPSTFVQSVVLDNSKLVGIVGEMKLTSLKDGIDKLVHTIYSHTF